MTYARSAAQPVQVAMFAVLSADPVLSGMGVGVYDDVPEGAPFPYVVIGECMETPGGSHGRFGMEVVPTIHVWSAYRGNAEVAAIADRVVALFHQRPLEIAGHDHISTRFEYRQTLRDPVQRLRHVPVRFRIETSQTEE